MRILYGLLGLLLLPVAVAVSRTLLALLVAVRPESDALIPASTLALGGGYTLWLILYFTLPRPVRAYILAHELTHALWGAVMGARVVRMRIQKDRGSVTLTKTNVWITLAPYFFPLYTVLVVAGYYLLAIFYDVGRYEWLWLGLVGFTWGFHFSFTISSLMQHQSDITPYGRLFAYPLIYLLNVLGICLWVVLVASPTLDDLTAYGGFHLRESAAWLDRTVRAVFTWACNRIGLSGVI